MLSAICSSRSASYPLDRAGAALLGASLMVGSDVLSLEDAYSVIDFGTITLLLPAICGQEHGRSIPLADLCYTLASSARSPLRSSVGLGGQPLM
jgi:hypothetical protein